MEKSGGNPPPPKETFAWLFPMQKRRFQTSQSFPESTGLEFKSEPDVGVKRSGGTWS